MKNRIQNLLFTAPLCMSAVLVLAGRAEVSNLGRILHRTSSLYYNIFVYENGSVRTLKFGTRPDAAIQSQVDLNEPRRHLLEYTELMFCGLLVQPQPQRVLVLGLGGGVIPRQMRQYFPQTQIDVVEIDPEVAAIAKKYFAFTEDEKLKVHIDDGRMFIRKRLRDGKTEKYDLILLDAFNGDYIPFHLMTKEFLEEVQRLLAEDGAVVANVFAANRLFDAEMNTFLAVFRECQVFFGAETSNAMLLSPGKTEAALTRKEAVERARQLQPKLKLSFNLPQIAGRLQPDLEPDPEAQVLTDDLAPVNQLKMQQRQTENESDGPS